MGTNDVKETHRIPWKNDEHRSPTGILSTTEKRARWIDKGIGEASVYYILMLSYIAAKALQLNLGRCQRHCQLMSTPTPGYCLAWCGSEPNAVTTVATLSTGPG